MRLALPERQNYEAEWHVISGRGHVAVINVIEPGVAVGEEVLIGGQPYTIRAIESHQRGSRRPERFIGERAGIVIQGEKR